MIEKISILWSYAYSIYFAEPVRLQLLAVPLAFFILAIISWLFWLYRRPEMTYGSKYSLFGRFKLWFSLTIALAIFIAVWSKPFMAGGVVVKRGNAEVIFIVDYSSSMLLKDTGISRIEIASRELMKLPSLGILQEGDRTALFVLGLQPVRYLPLTTDLSSFVNEASKLGLPTTLMESNIYWGSAIGSMLERVYTSLDRQDSFAIYKGVNPPESWQSEFRPNRLVIFLGDGDYFNYSQEEKQFEENDRQYFEAGLDEFRKRGLKIYPIGIGTRMGGNVIDILKDYSSGSEYDPKLKEDLEGQTSRLNFSILDYMRNATGADGIFLIENANVGAGDFIRTVINSHRSTIIEPDISQDKEELWLYFVLAAITVFLLGVIITKF